MKPDRTYSDFSVSLAPMEGVSDFPFRLWISLCSGPKKASTPFLRATHSYPKLFPIEFAPEFYWAGSYVNYQTTLQIMASESEAFIHASNLLPETINTIELNCGCPSPNSVGGGAGSSLLKDPEALYKLASQISYELGQKRLAIKMRTGFDSCSEFDKLIDAIDQVKVAYLSIHGRTRSQRYAGFSKWQLIQRAAQSIHLPVIGSGDITDLSSYQKRILVAPSITACIIGRGAIRNPWVFDEIRHQKKVSLSPSALKNSLMTYLILSYLHKHQPDQLRKMVEAGYFLETIGSDEEKWANLKTKLMIAISAKNPDSFEINIPHFSFNRLKLIWNYLRSSLSSEFFEPAVLRSKNSQDFFSRLDSLIHTFSQNHSSLEIQLAHNQNYDWIYSSDKKHPGSYEGY